MSAERPPASPGAGPDAVPASPALDPEAGRNHVAKLRILGKEVAIGCRAGEEDALKEAAAYIDGSMRDLKSRNATSSIEKIAIVAAINTADALLKARGRALPRTDDDAQTLAERLAAMNATLVGVLERQADAAADPVDRASTARDDDPA